MIVLMVLLTAFAFADVVNVTYVVNTSTVSGQGLTDSTHTVQICGSEVGPEGIDIWSNIFLTWDDASPLATNVGGDYWELTIAYPDSMIGWRMAYKVRYKANDADDYSWENFPDGNRMWTVPAADTTLQIAYAENSWEPPYTPSDSVDVFFRINVSADESHTDANPVSIVGDIPVNGSGTNMWSPTTYAMEEEGSGFWTYHLKLDPSVLPITNKMFRFHNGTADWGGNSENLNGAYTPGNENRLVSIGTNDTTLAWVWWNDVVGGAFEGTDTSDITVGVNMANAVLSNGFEVGDTLQVRIGYESSSVEVIETQMVHVGGTQSYSAVIEDVPLRFGEYLYYQYYMIKNGVEQREVYYNFNYTGDATSGAERRRIIVSGATATIADIEDDEAVERRMPFFRNNAELAQDVTVHVECDLRPAIASVAAGKTLTSIQGNVNITPADVNTILTKGVAVNGPLSNNGEGAWASWGTALIDDTTRAMHDDGTHGDATANDSIFTITYMFSPDSGHTVGQECKFGIGGGDNEGGEGGYGNNHVVNLDDSQAESYLYVAFGSMNPAFYNDWEFTPGVGVSSAVPSEFSLEQNYPNPFNPVTTINYHVANDAQVNLTVYDMTGRKISELVNSYAAAGSYSVRFDATNLASGVYFYQISAGSYRAVNKMILMK